jgi:fumarate reductase flavoprotein subunit
MIVGEFVADYCEGAELEVSTKLVREFVDREKAYLASLCNGGKEDPSALRIRMQDIMTSKVGIFRDGGDLASAVDELAELYRRSRNIGVGSHAPGANPELVTAYRTQKMLRLALTVACGAKTRTESRGAHFRMDFPQRNDQEWLKRTLATWPDPSADFPTLDYEPLDIMTMELPPGWRGYGARNQIDHPDTAVREQQVKETRERLAEQGRFAIQEALMPYEHLLPEAIRGRNERLGEKLP